MVDDVCVPARTDLLSSCLGNPTALLKTKVAFLKVLDIENSSPAILKENSLVIWLIKKRVCLKERSPCNRSTQLFFSGLAAFIPASRHLLVVITKLCVCDVMSTGYY